MTYNQEQLEETICDSFQHCRIYSSVNPNILGIHISPYVNSAYKNIQNILVDICTFNIVWSKNHFFHMNGFSTSNYKIVFHTQDWSPIDGYENNIYEGNVKI